MMNVLLLNATLAMLTVAADQQAPQPVEVDSVFLTLLEEVEVPSREAGTVMEMLLREGQTVQEGQLLARIDDTRARTAYEHTRIELDKARRLASNELKVQLAEKSLEVARVELQRALDSYKRVPTSVSKTELDQLRLAAERLELETEQARFDHQTAQLTLHSKQNELLSAEHDLERLRVTAPIAGFIVEVKRSRGEWVEPGQTVMRLVRMDRLGAEGVVQARYAHQDLTGRTVQLTVSLGHDRIEQFKGMVSFVSPEVHPVNGQVRIRADIENRELLLRPGLQAKMTIAP